MFRCSVSSPPFTQFICIHSAALFIGEDEADGYSANFTDSEDADGIDCVPFLLSHARILSSCFHFSSPILLSSAVVCAQICKG
jgi:hypothetical protein